MRIRTIVALLMTSLAVALVAYAQELKSPDGIFNFSTAKMTGYKTWSGDIVQTVNMFGSEVTTKGSITQKQPRKMRVQMDMPMMSQQMKMKMVMGDDGIMWQEMETTGGKQVIKMDMAKVLSNAMARTGIKLDPLKAMDPSQQWAVNREMMDYAAQGSRDLHGEPMYVLEGNWKQDALTNKQVAAVTASLGKMVVYVGQKDGFVHRYEQYGKSGTNVIMSMEVSNLKFNEDVSDDSFKYQPPPGVQVMDMTQMGAGATGGRRSQPAIPTPPPTPPR
jgi:outer membrane lipoprotein-sorting protein